MRTVFEAEGNIRGTDLLAGFVQLWRESASGALRFSRPGATAAFHLAAGDVVAVSASESRFETASILLRAGKLDAATLDRLVTPEGGNRAIYALQAGILTKREWKWGEKIRAVEVLSDLLTWIEGDYVFDRDESTTVGEFRLTVPRLVLELFLRSRDRALVLHYLGGADVPLLRAPRFDVEFAIFGLTADAEAVVRMIDGKATAAEIAREGPADAFAVEKLLAALVTLGLIHPAFAPDEPVAIREASPSELESEEEEDAEEAEEEQPVPAASEAAWAWEGSARGQATSADASGTEDQGEEEAGETKETPAEPPREIPSYEAEQELEPERGSGRPVSIDSHAFRSEPGMITDAPLDLSPSASQGLADGPEPQRPGREEIVDLDRRDRGAEPVFEKPLEMTTGIGRDERPRPRSAAPWLFLLAILAAGVAVVVLMRGGGPTPETGKLAVGATPTAAEVATIAEPAPTIAVSPIQAATPPAAAAAPTRIHPTPPPAPAPPTKAPPRPAPALAAAPSGRESGGELSRQGWLDRADRDQQRARGDRKAHFTIQLELACEVASLSDAWKHDRPAGTMWVVSTPFQGKTCFRVLWGRYPTREAAGRALASVPAFFSTPRNHPIVTAIH
jgi:Domain of unknown function (DUF4388)